MIDFALAFKRHINEEIVLCFGEHYNQKIYENFDFGQNARDNRDREMIEISYYVVEFFLTRFAMPHKVISGNVLAYSKRGYHRSKERCAGKPCSKSKAMLFSQLDKRLEDIFKKVNKGRPLITIDER